MGQGFNPGVPEQLLKPERSQAELCGQCSIIDPAGEEGVRILEPWDILSSQVTYSQGLLLRRRSVVEANDQVRLSLAQRLTIFLSRSTHWWLWQTAVADHLELGHASSQSFVSAFLDSSRHPCQ